VVLPLGICRRLARRWSASPLGLLSMPSKLKCSSYTSSRRWKCQVWCSRCVSVKPTLGHAWSAARALPRHAGQVCAGASGECVLLFLSLPSPLLLLLAMVSDHTGQDQWAKLTELALWCCCWMHVWFS
jgi:hypothetical protein